MRSSDQEILLVDETTPGKDLFENKEDEMEFESAFLESVRDELEEAVVIQEKTAVWVRDHKTRL